MNETDPEKLVIQARRGDTASLEILLVSHWDLLCAHVARRIPSTADFSISAEDVVQEALLEAFQKIDRLREPTPRVFLAWLKALGEMSLARVLRHQGRQKRGGHLKKVEMIRLSVSSNILNLIDELPEDAKSASSLLARTEALAALQVAVASLPDEQRHAVQLHVLGGESLDETAAKMARTTAAVRGLVHRGKQNIAESMGRASQWFSKE